MKHAGLFAVSISVLVMFTLVHEGSKLNMIDRGIKRTSYTNIDKLKKNTQLETSTNSVKCKNVNTDILFQNKQIQIKNTPNF